MKSTRATLHSIINTILVQSKSHTLASRMLVFGSIAQGKTTPSDLDLVLDYSDLDYDTFLSTVGFSQVNFLLIWAHRCTFRFIGHFDPFIQLKDELLCRNADATGWCLASNSRTLSRTIKRDARPLADIPLLPECFE